MKKLIYFFICLMITVPAWADDVLVLNENDMAEALLNEFIDQGYGEEAEFEFFGGKTTFALQDVTLARIMISNLKLDEEANKFTANAEIFAEGNLVEKTNLSGKFYHLVSAYVPQLDIAKGKTISEEVLKEIKVRANRVKHNNIIDKGKLVGLEAKKTLQAGKLVVEREVGQTVIVHKGDTVTAMYNAKGLQITSKAEALENGALGQRIELENLKSGKKFRAKVTDVNVVEIDNE